MAGVRGLFVRKSGTAGTTPVAARKDIAGLVAATAAFGARPGVISGCVVSGTSSGWTYSVSAGHLVTARSAADGALPWANDAATSVATSAAPASGSRIDIIYAKHNDVDNGDADNVPTIDVVSGVASGSPVAPSLPTGAIELGRCTLASGAANTAAGTFSSANVQYTTSRGAPIPVISQTQRDALSGLASLTNPITVYRIDTGRIERNVGGGWYDIDGQPWAAYTPTLTASTNPTLGSGSSATGRWTRGNGVMQGNFDITFGGSGTAAGSGEYFVSLPAAVGSGATGKVIGTAWLLGTGAYAIGVVFAVGGSAARIRLATNTTVNSTNPWAWGANHALRGNFAAEV